MRREPKVVDVEPVSRAARVRQVLSLVLLAVIAAGIWVFYLRTEARRNPRESAEATSVRSTVVPDGDSLEVAVDWTLLIDSLRALPESLRVEVGLSDGHEASISTQPADRTSDTLRVAAPGPGQTATGYSCVAPIHRGQIRRERCTSWQFVRPAADTISRAAPDTVATADTARRRTAAVTPRVVRVVVQPAGLQVDLDTDGRCARWQRENPGRPVWVDVNRSAVPECTGANGKPVIAQFCAFAELEDGRRVKTANSSRDPYCDRLFQEWARERIS
jgi:hypothetical protein